MANHLVISSQTSSPPPPTPGTSRRAMRSLAIVGGIVLVWFVMAEVATNYWYSSHESKMTKNQVPSAGETLMERLKAFAGTKSPSSSEKDIGTAAMEMLKCSYGKTLIWADGPAAAAVTLLKWDERSVVGGVESMHNPGACLGAAGWKIGKRTVLGIQNYCGTSCEVIEWEVSRGDTNMRAFSAVFRRFVEENRVAASKFSNSERLKPVIAGRRDAPVLVLLAYLPTNTGGAGVHERFREIMQSLFCKPGAAAPTL